MKYVSFRVAATRPKCTFILSLFLTLVSLADAEESVWKDQEGRSAPNTESRASKNDFGGWLVVTPDADWKQKWETSPDTIPYFSTSSTVEKGKQLFILIFFVNPDLDDNHNADVTYDIESVRPDGSFSIKQKDVVCLRGKLEGNSYYLRLAPSIIKFVGEPKDLPGKWTVHVTLKDNRRSVELPLKTSFTLK
ncbi:MAG: hypothetical protein QOG67_3855 [Verrucomicrobiota bacterium]|jgi:hypothetical protein